MAVLPTSGSLLKLGVYMFLRSPNLGVVPRGPGRRTCTWYVVSDDWVVLGPGVSWVLAPGVSWVSART